MGSNQFCYSHDESRGSERDEARRKGGHNRASAVRLRGLVPPRLLATYDVLEEALGEVHRGELDPKQANAMASIARAMVAVLQTGELEERMRNVEARLTTA